MIGLEGWRVGRHVFSPNAVQACGASSPMDLSGLFRFIKEMHPFCIQIGGFVAHGSYPFTSRGLHPSIRSFGIDGSMAVVMGWPVADTSYPMTLDSLRRECKRYNVLHKYHQKEDDVDNDFFLVLGRVERTMLSEEKLEVVQVRLRRLLAEQEPLHVLLMPDDLSVIAYTDTQLPVSSSVKYSLVDALPQVEELKLLYHERVDVKGINNSRL
jgi:hypothetical protein